MSGSFETLALHLLRTTLVTGIAVLVVMWLLQVLRIRSPRLHRVAWLLVLLQGWLLVPVTWQVVVEATEPIAPAPVYVDEPEVVMPLLTPLETNSDLDAPVAHVTLHEAASPEPVAPEPFDITSFLSRWSLAGWLAGMTVLVGMGAWRYLKLFAAGRPGELATEPAWLDEWCQARERGTLRWPVELRTTHGLGPLVCWVPWVFLVLVPRTLWASLTRADRLAILRHELAHCERGDLWKNLAVRVLALPQWFNPLVWLAVRRFEEAGEWACDDRVAATAGSMDYAKTLLQIADQIAPLPSGAVGMASGVLTRRVERLLHYPNKEVREMRGILLPVLLMAVGLLQVVRIERVAAEETTSPGEVIDAPSHKGPSTRVEKMPAYTIEPPDVITVDIADVVHKSPRTIQPYDQLVYRRTEANPNDGAPCLREQSGVSQIIVAEDGEASFDRGCRFNVCGFTIEQAERMLGVFLERANPKSKVEFSLMFAPGAPQITGEHLVGPDGKVHFGKRYGAVGVAGLVLDEAKQRIEEHLSYYLVDPKVTVDILAYNSKRFYVVTNNQRGGRSIDQLPIAGNETVLDALAMVGGVKGPQRIWVERPYGNGTNHRVMLVNYEAITSGNDNSTNHQLLPNDRLFVEYADPSRRQVTPDDFPPGVRVTPYAGPGGGELLAVWEDAYRTPMPSASHRTSRVAELRVEGPQKVRYRIGLVIDPKRTIRGMEIDKEGPIMLGESSIMLGMLRVLQKNELAHLFEGQLAVTDVGGESKSISMHLEDTALLAKSLQLDKVDADRLRAAGGFTLRAEERVLRTGNDIVFEVRGKLQQGNRLRPIGAGAILKEGQSCLVRFPTDEEDAGDAYLLITRGAM